MSWSVSGTGRASALAIRIEKDFENYTKCSEPEESIKQKARELIVLTLQGQVPPDQVVTVTASGSQSISGDSNSGLTAVRNQLKIEIYPIYNFVE